MRLSSLSLTALLLFSSVLFAQHSSGGSSGGGSSSSGGGGSHSASSGGSSSGGGGGSHVSSSGSSYSGGHSSGHVSGGGGHATSGASHGSGGLSGSHVSHGHVSNSGMSAHPSKSSEARSRAVLPIRDPNFRSQKETAQPQRRSFFSFLRHPFRRPQPKPAPELRRPVCFRGPCLACPAGQAHAGGGCASLVINAVTTNDYCSNGQIWSGGTCLQRIHFLGDCSWLLLELQRQQQRMQAAALTQQKACTAGLTMECSSATNAWHSEEALYHSLQLQYQQCAQRSTIGYPLMRYSFSPFRQGMLLDPLTEDLDY